MKYTYLVFTTLALAAGAMGQGSVNSSPLTVLEHKWKANTSSRATASLDSRDSFAANDAARQAIRDQKAVDRDNAERLRRGDGANGPKTRPTVSTDDPTFVGYRSSSFTYQAKVENTGPQPIREVTWEYAFLDPASGKILSSQIFQTNTEIKPGERETLKETSRSLPPFLARTPAAERITVKSVRYTDGTIWNADPN